MSEIVLVFGGIAVTSTVLMIYIGWSLTRAMNPRRRKDVREVRDDPSGDQA